MPKRPDQLTIPGPRRNNDLPGMHFALAASNTTNLALLENEAGNLTIFSNLNIRQLS